MNKRQWREHRSLLRYYRYINSLDTESDQLRELAIRYCLPQLLFA